MRLRGGDPCVCDDNKGATVMTYKRATHRLRAAGIEDIIIVRRLYGAAPENIMWERQHSQCFRTANEAAEAVLDGFRPTHISPSDEPPPPTPARWSWSPLLQLRLGHLHAVGPESDAAFHVRLMKPKRLPLRWSFAVCFYFYLNVSARLMNFAWSI